MVSPKLKEAVNYPDFLDVNLKKRKKEKIQRMRWRYREKRGGRKKRDTGEVARDKARERGKEGRRENTKEERKI